MKKLCSVLVVLLALTSLAHAKEWTIDYDHSKLGFVGDQNGEKFNGGFKKFQASVNFDPTAPESGSISVDVDIATAFAGTPERDDMLPQKDWFDTSVFPHARFVSTTIRKTGANTYTVDGTVTIKGVKQDISLPFILTQDGDHWRARGQVSLMRNAFGVGIDMFSDESYVKNKVDVTIDIAAK